jgi:hypothetical protein
MGRSIGITQSRSTLSITSRQVECPIDEHEVISKLIKIALLLSSLVIIAGILQASLGITDLSIQNLDSSEYGVDIVSESDSSIMVFGSLLKDLDRNISTELILSCIDLS